MLILHVKLLLLSLLLCSIEIVRNEIFLFVAYAKTTKMLNSFWYQCDEVIEFLVYERVIRVYMYLYICRH